MKQIAAIVLCAWALCVQAENLGETSEHLDELGLKPRIWLTFNGGWTAQGAEETKWHMGARGSYKPAAARGGKEAAYELGASCPSIFETKLDEEYTIITTVKGGAISNGLIWAIGSAAPRRGATRVVALGFNGKGAIRVGTWWGGAPDSKMELMKQVPTWNLQYHQYALVSHKERKAELYVDGKLADHTEGWDGARPGWECCFGGLFWAGPEWRGGYGTAEGVAIDDFRIYDQAFTEQQILQISSGNRPWPENVPVPRGTLSGYVDTNIVQRFGYEIPEHIVIGQGGDKRLYGRGILAQCGIGGPKSFDLNPGGLLAIGDKGFVFDSNYAFGRTNFVTFAGGNILAYAPSLLKSAAPIRLTGTVTIKNNDAFTLKTSFEGPGTIIKTGKGKMGLQYPCPNATGKIIVKEGALVMGPAATWGGKIEKRGKGKVIWMKSDVRAHEDTFPQPATAYNLAKVRLPKLGRGVYAWRLTNDVTRVSWRYKGTDPTNVTFDVYCNKVKVNKSPIDKVTYFDHHAPWTGKARTYEVRTTHQAQGTKHKAPSTTWHLPANAPIGYNDILLTPPKDNKTPDGHDYTYFPSDCSVGDLDGDGELDLVVCWWPTASGDNFPWGQPGETMLEGVKLDGTSRSLWRINLGPNIRSGPHYNPFVVADLDGDGSAEIVVRTSDGTVDGKGRTLNGGVFAFDNAGKVKDWRPEDCMVVFAPNYLTCFSGRTGAALDTIPYRPAILDDAEAIKNKNYWLVNWVWGSRMPGNQAFRFLAGAAYLDGVHPTAVMCRGYYSRTGIWAVDFDGKHLKERWLFLTDEQKNWGYNGQGFHNLYFGDVDFDGKDEVIYGHMCVDHNGEGLWTTGYGHGDAQSLFQASPETRGLYNWTCHEHWPFGVSLLNAQTGETLLRRFGAIDTGSCNAMDIDPEAPGVEIFSGAHCGIYSAKTLQGYMWPIPRPQTNYYATLRSHILWLGDMTASAYSGGSIIWGYSTRGRFVWPVFDGGGEVDSNGSTKGNPCLIADIFGDWREELLLRRKDNRAIRIFSSPEPTQYRFHTFLEDPMYFDGIISSNSGYNVPTTPGFYFGPDLKGHHIWFRGTYLP